MTFSLWFLGAEQPGWRTLLDDCGVDTIATSFWGLSRRLPKRRELKITDWGFDRVYLDSGGYSANKATMTVGEAEGYAATYRAFVEANIDDLEMVSEFDYLPLGPAWIERQRRAFWDHIDPHQFLPMWHPDQGLTALEELASRYPRVGVTQGAIDGQINVTHRLAALARGGTLLHGVAITKPEVLRSVDFTSAGSTSWLSPSQYGDTIIWDQNRLIRYPKRMKEQARERHRMAIIDAGFDYDRIAADDNGEVLRLSVWSWLQFQASLNNPSNYTPHAADTPESGNEGEGVETNEGDKRNVVRTPAITRATEILPVVSFVTPSSDTINEDGTPVERSPELQVLASSQRVCDHCYVAQKGCPKYQPGYACGYELPIEIKTKGQRAAMVRGMAEMQAQRLWFTRFNEELNGGYPDQNTGQEYDRLMKTFQIQAELEDDRDFLRISVEGRGQVGAISRLFGRVGPPPLADEDDVRTPLNRGETDTILGRVLEGQPVLEPKKGRKRVATK